MTMTLLKRLTCASLMGGLLVAGTLTGPIPARAATDGDLDARLSRGEVVVLMNAKHPIYHFRVYGIVDAPPDRVWKAITSYSNYNEFLPLVTESQLKRRVNHTAYQYLTMSAPWPFIKHWMINENTEDRVHGILSFKQDKGNVKLEYGYWQVWPMPNGKTKLLYNLTADPWMDYVPQWLVGMVTKQFLPDVIKGVRKRTAQNAQS